jgi:hypothetical protein
VSDWLRPEAWRDMLTTPSLLRTTIRSRFGDLYGQIASVLAGRQLELELGGATLFAVIESVTAVPPEKAPIPTMGARVMAFETLTLKLRHVEWGTRKVRAATVTVSDVAMVYDPSPVLKTGAVEIVGHIDPESAASWLDELNTPLDIDLDPEEGLVVARPHRWLSNRALVEPSLTRDGVHLKVNRLEILGRALPLPRSFGLGVTLALPHMPAGIELVDVWIEDGELVMSGRRSHIDREIGLADAMGLLDSASGSSGPIRVSRDGHISVG